MKFKKLLQGMFFTAAFAAAFAITGAVDASAATAVDVKNSKDTKVGTVTIDTNTQKLTYTVTKAKDVSELLVGIGTLGKAKITVDGSKVSKDVVKVPAWNTYDVPKTANNTIEVDLSKLTNTKDNYIEIRVDDGAPILFKIPAVDKSSVATYDASVDTIEFKAGDKKSEKAVSSFQYRTAYGSWTTVGELEEGKITGTFSAFQHQGATLYLRTPGTSSSDNDLTAADSSLEIYDATEGKRLTSIYESSKLPGKEVKLAIAKKANGPKVTLDYANAAVTFAKGTEWRLVAPGSANTANSSQKTPDAGYKKEAVGTFLGEDAEAGKTETLEVRTAAVQNTSTPKKSKTSSNWTRVAIQAPSALDSSWFKVGAVNTKKVDVEVGEDEEVTEQWLGNAGVKDSVIYGADSTGESPDTSKSVVTAEYTQDKKKTKYTGVKLTNKGADIYQVIVVPKGGDVDKEAATAKNIKTLKAAGKSDATLALTAADESVIYIRKAGNAKTTTWVGKFVEFGTVDFYKTVKK